MHTLIVSVVMPVRNSAAFIDEAIRSIRAQSLTGWELIIVDDGSIDASASIAGRHAVDDERIRILTLPSSGIGVALNHGLVAARCDYVARLDADDVAMPERLARQIAVLDAHPRVAALGSACDLINVDGAMTGQMGDAMSPDDIRAAPLTANCLAHSSVMVRRQAALAAGGYRPAFAPSEDYDLWLRLAERHDLMSLGERLVRHRCHDGQVSRTDAARQALTTLAAQIAARERRAGRADPAAGVRLLDRDTLLRMGIDETTIREAG